MSQEPKAGDNVTCHPLREALWLGLCQLRFGAVETTIYARLMARLERRERAAVTQSKGATGLRRDEE